MPPSTKGRLRTRGTPRGSTIWNLEAENGDLIRNHNFWEIGGRQSDVLVRCMEKRENLIIRQYLLEIFLFTNRSANPTTNKFWGSGARSTWREWKSRQHWPNAPDSPQWAAYDKEVNYRRITISKGPDILRWGYKNKGMLTIQEDVNGVGPTNI